MTLIDMEKQQAKAAAEYRNTEYRKADAAFDLALAETIVSFLFLVLAQQNSYLHDLFRPVRLQVALRVRALCVRCVCCVLCVFESVCVGLMCVRASVRAHVRACVRASVQQLALA
jgi:hypothetical protein